MRDDFRPLTIFWNIITSPGFLLQMNDEFYIFVQVYKPILHVIFIHRFKVSVYIHNIYIKIKTHKASKFIDEFQQISCIHLRFPQLFQFRDVNDITQCLSGYVLRLLFCCIRHDTISMSMMIFRTFISFLTTCCRRRRKIITGKIKGHTQLNTGIDSRLIKRINKC